MGRQNPAIEVDLTCVSQISLNVPWLDALTELLADTHTCDWEASILSSRRTGRWPKTRALGRKHIPARAYTAVLGQLPLDL